MNAVVEMVLKKNLKQLRLPMMLKEMERSVRQAKESQISYEEFLLQLTETELASRAENTHRRRLQEGHFPQMKPIETFDGGSTPDLNMRLVKELCQGEYIKESRNIVLLGRSGTGKTHLATALGMEACRQGYRTRFTTGCGLVNELLEARDDRQLGRTLQRYSRYDLLIVDELGYVPFSKEGAELLFQVFAERHERKSVIITTNIGFADWTQIFGDAHLTAALLDRLTHRAHIISFSWESYRLKETLKRRQMEKEGNVAR
jgi:DNA replication protein DnaC